MQRARDHHARLVGPREVAQEAGLGRVQPRFVVSLRQGALGQLQRVLAVAAATEQLGHLVEHVGLVRRDLQRRRQQVERIVELTEPPLDDGRVVERRPELGLQVQPEPELRERGLGVAPVQAPVGGLREPRLEVRDVDLQHRAHGAVARREILHGAHAGEQLDARLRPAADREQAQPERDAVVAAQRALQG